MLKWIGKYCICKILASVSVDEGSIRVGKMMEKANIVQAEALKQDKNREKQKIRTTSHKLAIYSRTFKMHLCNISSK